MDLKDLYRDVIVDHNRHPRNFGKLEPADAHADGFNPQMHALLTQQDAGVDAGKLGKLAALSGVREFPARVKCASLCWHTLNAALERHAEPVSTE